MPKCDPRLVIFTSRLPSRFEFSNVRLVLDLNAGASLSAVRAEAEIPWSKTLRALMAYVVA